MLSTNCARTNNAETLQYNVSTRTDFFSTLHPIHTNFWETAYNVRILEFDSDLVALILNQCVAPRLISLKHSHSDRQTAY